MNNTRLSSADFRKFRPARRVNGDFFSVSLATDAAGPKWACVVSKKVSTKAPVRNLVKRRTRALLRVELEKFAQPVSIVFQAKRGAGEASFAQLKEDVRKLLERAGLRGTMSAQ